jgi:hypothetical protein
LLAGDGGRAFSAARLLQPTLERSMAASSLAANFGWIMGRWLEQEQGDRAAWSWELTLTELSIQIQAAPGMPQGRKRCRSRARRALLKTFPEFLQKKKTFLGGGILMVIDRLNRRDRVEL